MKRVEKINVCFFRLKIYCGYSNVYAYFKFICFVLIQPILEKGHTMCLYRQCINAEQDMHSLAKICWTVFVLLLLFAVSYELA